MEMYFPHMSRKIDNKKFEVLHEILHIHPADPIKATKVKFNAKFKEFATISCNTSNAILSSVIGRTSINKLPFLFRRKFLQKNITNINKKNKIDSRNDSEIQNIYTKTLSSEKLILFDGLFEGKNIIIFTTKKNLTHLSKSIILLSVETFSFTPPGFFQVLVIQGLVKNKALPFVCALHANKKEIVNKFVLCL